MTALQFVRRYFPRASEQEAHVLMWEFTAWPCCGLEHAGKQLAAMSAFVRPKKRGWKRRARQWCRRWYASLDAALESLEWPPGPTKEEA